MTLPTQEKTLRDPLSSPFAADIAAARSRTGRMKGSMLAELMNPGLPDLGDAYRDDLTKIANRRFFELRLNECLAASLSQMVNFPLDKIKIARSLIAEESTGIKERAIVRAIAALGNSLGISTVVEGVSTPEHLSRIQMDGCSSIQGCLFNEAVSSEMLKNMAELLITPNRISKILETRL